MTKLKKNGLNNEEGFGLVTVMLALSAAAAIWGTVMTMKLSHVNTSSFLKAVEIRDMIGLKVGRDIKIRESYYATFWAVSAGLTTASNIQGLMDCFIGNGASGSNPCDTTVSHDFFLYDPGALEVLSGAMPGDTSKIFPISGTKSNYVYYDSYGAVCPPNGPNPVKYCPFLVYTSFVVNCEDGTSSCAQGYMATVTYTVTQNRDSSFLAANPHYINVNLRDLVGSDIVEIVQADCNAMQQMGIIMPRNASQQNYIAQITGGSYSCTEAALSVNENLSPNSGCPQGAISIGGACQRMSF